MKAPTLLPPGHEASGWLRSTAARRARQIERMGFDLHDAATPLVVAPIGKAARPGEREDRTCDRCRTYVPEGETLHLFIYAPAPRLHLTGAWCQTCRDKEGGGDVQ